MYPSFLSEIISKHNNPIIYYNFDHNAQRIDGFQFRNLRADTPFSVNNPTEFDLVGSNDCKEWKTVKSVGRDIPLSWNGFDELKFWIIDDIDRKTFLCWGIQINGVDRDMDLGVAIQDLSFWHFEKPPSKVVV